MTGGLVNQLLGKMKTGENCGLVKRNKMCPY